MYVVHADIQNCLDIKGVRAHIYTEAQQNQAYYTIVGRDTAISYEGNILRLNLCFKVEEQANNMQSWLVLANEGRLLIASLKRCILSISVKAVTAVRLSERVLVTDYDPAASTSPAETYADIKLDDASSRTGSSHSAAINSEFVQCQSIENPRALWAFGVDTAHIVPRGECVEQHVVDDNNNHLALSRALHYSWDGPHHSTPVVGIRPAGVGEPFFTPEPQPASKRHRVGVVVVPREQDDADVVCVNLKEGTVRRMDADGGVCFCS